MLLRARAQARNIRATGGLGEQLAPDLLARRKLRQQPSLIGLGAIGHHGRSAHAFADLERLGQLAVDALPLWPDPPLTRRGAAAAIFRWPVQAGPARIRLLLLPAFCDIDDV